MRPLSLSGEREFARVFEHGSRRSCRTLTVRALVRPEGGEPRVGFITPTRIGNSVVRHRLRRLLREALRSADLPAGTDLVISVSPPGAALAAEGLAALQADLQRPLRQALAAARPGSARS